MNKQNYKKKNQMHAAVRGQGKCIKLHVMWMILRIGEIWEKEQQSVDFVLYKNCFELNDCLKSYTCYVDHGGRETNVVLAHISHRICEGEQLTNTATTVF